MHVCLSKDQISLDTNPCHSLLCYMNSEIYTLCAGFIRRLILLSLTALILEPWNIHASVLLNYILAMVPIILTRVLMVRAFLYRFCHRLIATIDLHSRYCAKQTSKANQLVIISLY